MSSVQTGKRVCLSVSVSLLGALLSHEQLTLFFLFFIFLVAKAMPCLRVQFDTLLGLMTLVHVFITMVTASGVTVNEENSEPFFFSSVLVHHEVLKYCFPHSNSATRS